MGSSRILSDGNYLVLSHLTKNYRIPLRGDLDEFLASIDSATQMPRCMQMVMVMGKVYHSGKTLFLAARCAAKAGLSPMGVAFPGYVLLGKPPQGFYLLLCFSIVQKRLHDCLKTMEVIRKTVKKEPNASQYEKEAWIKTIERKQLEVIGIKENHISPIGYISTELRQKCNFAKGAYYHKKYLFQMVGYAGQRGDRILDLIRNI